MCSDKPCRHIMAGVVLTYWHRPKRKAQPVQSLAVTLMATGAVFTLLAILQSMR